MWLSVGFRGGLGAGEWGFVVAQRCGGTAKGGFAVARAKAARGGLLGNLRACLGRGPRCAVGGQPVSIRRSACCCDPSTRCGAC